MENDRDPIICPECGGTGQHPWLNSCCRYCGGTGEVNDYDCYDNRYKIQRYRGTSAV